MNIQVISNVGASLNADSQKKITNFQDDQQKKSYEEKITQKIKSGAKLTASELDYLRVNNPDLYVKAARMQMKRDLMEQKLENCKSKKEVEDAVSFELGSVAEKDPDREIIINAIFRVTKEFKKTTEYKSLPEKTKEEQKNADEDTKEPSATGGIDVRL